LKVLRVTRRLEITAENRRQRAPDCRIADRRIILVGYRLADLPRLRWLMGSLAVLAQAILYDPELQEKGLRHNR
jgi:hypothetical protein